MNYKTSYFWQQEGRNETSLILQHLKEKRGRLSIVFVVMCRTQDVPAAGDFFQTRLLDWFRYKGLSLCAKGRQRDMERLQNALEDTILHVVNEMAGVCSPEKMDCVGMIGVGERAILFSSGRQRIYLIHKGFGMDKIRRLNPDREGFWIQQADMQPGIGILMGTDSFFAPYSEKILTECMSVAGLEKEKAGEKRLRELGMGAECSGGQNVCAVLLLTENTPHMVTRKMEHAQGQNTQVRSAERQRTITEQEMMTQQSMITEQEMMTQQGMITGQEMMMQQGMITGQEMMTQQSMITGQEMITPQRIMARQQKTVARQRMVVPQPGKEAQSEECDILQRKGYRTPQLVGEGTFSRVYRAWDEKKQQMVACKVSGNRAMLEREAEYLSGIKHPLFVSFFDYFEESGRGILVMEYVYGSSLKTLLARRGKMSVRQTVGIGMELADGLRYLHEREKAVIHRDIKPEHILIREDGVVKLIDMGCAGSRGSLEIAGSRGYAAPEQLLGNAPADTYTDVYGLGRVLLQILPAKAPERLRQILEACTRAEKEERIPDMRFLMGLLLSYHVKRNKRLHYNALTKFQYKHNICLFSPTIS